MNTFTAVSNLSYRGRTPSAGDPADEQPCQSLDEARQWLASRGGAGGVISAYDPALRDWRIVALVDAGPDGAFRVIPARTPAAR